MELVTKCSSWENVYQDSVDFSAECHKFHLIFLSGKKWGFFAKTEQYLISAREKQISKTQAHSQELGGQVSLAPLVIRVFRDTCISPTLEFSLSPKNGPIFETVLCLVLSYCICFNFRNECSLEHQAGRYCS